MTQAEVAVELGVSRPLLIAIEKGTREASPPELVRMAELYNRPLSDLLRASDPPVAIGAKFRTALASAPGASALSASVEALERSADLYLDLLRRASATLPGHMAPPRRLDGLDTEVAAETLALDERMKLGLGDGPIERLRDILELEASLRIFVLPLPSSVSGLFVFVEPLGGCAAINAHHPRERRRWTAAHEFAHFIVSPNKAEVTELPGQKRSTESERFADAFAANFLMPRTGLTRRFNDLRRGSPRGATPASLVHLAHNYGVSAQAMTLRLEHLGLIPEGTWEKLIAHDFKPRRAAEQLGLTGHDEGVERFPSHYRRLAVQLYADGAISESQLATYLETDLVGARSVYRDLTSTSDVNADGATQVLDLLGSD